MGDFNLGAYAGIGAITGGLASYGKRKRKQHDAGEDYYLELSTSKNFKLRPGEEYRRGMTKVQVRKLFVEDTDPDDEKTVNQWERKLLQNAFSRKKDVWDGIPQDAIISERVMGFVTQTERTRVTEDLGKLSHDLKIQKEINRVLEKFGTWKIKNAQDFEKALKDPSFVSIFEGLAREAQLKIEDVAKPGKFYELLRDYGLDFKIPGFIPMDKVSTPSEATRKAKSVEEFIQIMRENGWMRNEGTPEQVKAAAMDFGKTNGANWAKTVPAGVTETPALEQNIQRALQKPGEEPIQEAATSPIQAREEVPTPETGTSIATPSSNAKINKYKALMLALKMKRNVGKTGPTVGPIRR